MTIPTITTTINNIAKKSSSISDFRSKLKPEIAKLKPSLIRKDLFRSKLTKQMWLAYQETRYIDYPDKGIQIIMEETTKAKACR